MNWNDRCRIVTIPAILFGFAACAGERVPPKSLVDARTDFVHAKSGIAMQLDPTDVHEADLALQRAERAWADSPDDPSTVDFALIADRKALLADSNASTFKAQQDWQQAKSQLDATHGVQLQNAEGQLNQTQQALGTAQVQIQRQQVEGVAQQQRMEAMEAKLRDARDTIAKIAAVKDDDRGMVITLQGEVLFKTGLSDLKPAAMAKFDEIAGALNGKDQPITVFGYTDNVGTRDNNMSLSQRRADSVRTYLLSKGIPQDLITAQGKGPDAPVADNQSIEGRAQNRRVEIVVQPQK
jgi:outer membrane protein OmpA-like peptidoglycan-associated protein